MKTFIAAFFRSFNFNGRCRVIGWRWKELKRRWETNEATSSPFLSLRDVLVQSRAGHLRYYYSSWYFVFGQTCFVPSYDKEITERLNRSMIFFYRAPFKCNLFYRVLTCLCFLTLHMSSWHLAGYDKMLKVLLLLGFSFPLLMQIAYSRSYQRFKIMIQLMIGGGDMF